jgi:adenosylhomocysteine nucleosidase
MDTDSWVRRDSLSDGRIVILTALNLEYQAVHRKLIAPRMHRHSAGTLFETGQLGPHGCQVALGLVGKGNHPAAVLAERAIAEFSPAAVLFVGVAGALRPWVGLGDVVVASHVHAYHGALSEDDGPKARPRTWELAHSAAQIVQHLIRTGEWFGAQTPESPPHVHFGAIAAGEVVQNSKISEQARWIREHYNDALAIEMEAAGVAQAAHLNRSLPVVVIRGISDRADGTKATTDADSWQPRAAANAAAFATALAPLLAAGDGRGHPIGKASEEVMGASFRNIATGNARVAVQAGQIFTHVAAGRHPEPATGLRADIAALRGLIDRAHQDGRLDADTHAAAESELDTAESSQSDRRELSLSLRRFRGLTFDVPEIATAIEPIITDLRGRS